MSDTLVPEPQASIFDSVTKALGNDEDAARRVMLNPNLAKGFKDGKPVNKESKKDGQDTCAAVIMPTRADAPNRRMTTFR